MAYWYGENGQICPYDKMYDVPRPGEIIYFFKHLLYVNDVCMEHVLCFVEWFTMLGDEERYFFGKPIEICHAKIHDLGGPASFIPVQRLKSKFVSVVEDRFNKEVMVVLPRYRTLNV